MSSLLLRRFLRGSNSAAVRSSPLALRNCMGTTSTGSVLPKPHMAYSFGTLRVVLWSIPFIYTGAMAAKYMASSLEEFDLFVPDDDDD